MKFLARSLPLSSLIRRNGNCLEGVGRTISQTLMNTDLIREIFRTKAQIFIVMELDPNARLSTILSRRLKANNALNDSDWDKILLSVAMLFSGMDENFIHG